MTFVKRRGTQLSGGGSMGQSGLLQDTPSCSACGKRKVGLCICPCEKAYYCGTACQEQDWAQHAASCRHGRPHKTPVTACSGCGSVSASNAWCQCATVLYCSRQCQLKHWTEGHKAECTPFYKHQQQQSRKQSSVVPGVLGGDGANRFLDLLDQLKKDSEGA